jgi:hypothetical protein
MDYLICVYTYSNDVSSFSPGSRHSSVNKRGPSRKLEEHERYRIKEINEDGELIAPAAHTNMLVRDNIPITIREWKKTKMEPVSYVHKRFKNMLWKKLMVNFTLRQRQGWIEIRRIQMRRIII